MTNNTQMTNINELFMQFLSEHGSQDIVQEWQKPQYQEKLMELLPKTSKTAKTSGKKDPNKPKRGKSSYIFFCADHRAAVKEELGDEAKATEVTAELGKKWNELKESKKTTDKKKLAKYEEQAKQDKERYQTEMEGYEPPSDEELEEAAAARKRKSSGKKDPNKPKRGKSSYIFFCADHRAAVKEELGDVNATEVTVELGRQWNELKESKKVTDKKKLAKYEEQAKQDKERYQTEMEGYEPEQVTAHELSPPIKKNKTSEKKTSEKKLTGYHVFCKKHREQVKEENPELKAVAVTKILAEMWKALPEDEKSQWKTMAGDN